jgi:predicted TIM-barrel fold metal-dependent hydrolase
MANEYPCVYLDIAGDIFDYRLLEKLVQSAPAEKILYGSDFPWMDLHSRLSHVLLADIEDSVKGKILHGNAIRVYRLGVS